ncbi:DUF5696 domain-containing protein [Paenibacillus crassostreae]|uniref:Uncharacterized protein n=1 Tax=Paenibacillus crassostreae TaxID=1763538 RepID=A0A167GRJ4_9BACL|nr:DUF5696 domain-containing protein [Paenibacillus crassostreae]AOZ92025.1 hypothetical protein LPB68_07185 [Paenibacillus crassostreae]OAB77834.1 hypothetical protein PNBC_00265 [Paenibacillus crassostreae]
MNKRKVLYRILTCVVLLGIAASVLIYINRGVPAVDVAAYVQGESQLAPGSEMAILNDNTDGVSGMVLVAQNTALGLYINPETTEVAVLDKQQGQVWYSNPPERNDDELASAFEKEVLSSQVGVSFRDAIATLETYNNFSHSISKQQFTTESIANGIRITYTLGDMSLGIDVLPKYISKSRFQEKIVDSLDDASKRYVSARYYPTENNPEVMERLDEQISKQLVMNKMIAAFEKAGYTAEDLAFDNDENGISSGNASNKPNFVIPLEYHLEENSLVVSVPMSQIQESAAHQIKSIDMLNYFGSAGKEDEGYMFVPDGMGSLIYLNNGKVKDELYAQRVYGTDENDNSRSRGQVSEDARMPVYGLKSGDGAWFAVIEEGDAIASVNADISGKKNSFNHVYSSFEVRGEDELELYTGQTIQEIDLLSADLYQGDIRIRYSFLSGKDATYSGMAKLYQNLLTKNNILTPLQNEQDIPFYLDMLGSVDKQQSFLGVPYDDIISMTSFDQAGEIAAKLNTDGISNLKMRYMGWFNKGVDHQLPVKMKVDRVLGDKGDFMKLAKQMEDLGGNLYPDVAFQHVYDDASFTPSSDAARFITREQAELSPYNRSFNRMDIDLGSYYLLSPAKLPYYVDKFTGTFSSFDSMGLSLRDLGDLLNSDYRENRVVYRESAKNIVVEQIRKLEESYPDLMLAGGNAYAWGYGDQLINIPTSSSGFNITDEAVPFYQMVIHGYLDYAGSPMNLDDNQDMKQQLLSAIELGASPHFLWTYEPSSKLKYTRFDTYYSSYYLDWYDQAVSMYEEANTALSSVRTKRMTEHIRHQPGVVEVRYEEGTSVYVNYSDESVTLNGVTVDAQDYVVDGDQE